MQHFIIIYWLIQSAFILNTFNTYISIPLRIDMLLFKR